MPNIAFDMCQFKWMMSCAQVLSFLSHESSCLPPPDLKKSKITRNILRHLCSPLKCRGREREGVGA